MGLSISEPTMQVSQDLKKRKLTVLESSSSAANSDREEKNGQVHLMRLANPHLTALSEDHLYHLGLHSGMDLSAMFGDVKFVLMGGSSDRMLEIITRAAKDLDLARLIPVGCSLAPIGKQERYHLYKLGPIISVSHGMGMPSISILLHELTKLLHYAGATDYCFVRIGTSGGLGVAPGTVVISSEAVNGLLQPFLSAFVLGKPVQYPSSLDRHLATSIFACKGDLPVVLGKTMSTSDFYEEQGRLDGFLCSYAAADRLEFLKRCHANGVRNIEMEALQFASFCARAKVPGAVVCTTLLDRLGDMADQVTASPAQLAEFADRAIDVVFAFIRARLRPAAASN